MTSFLLCPFKSRHLPFVACVFAAIAPSLSAQQAPVCAASPEVQAALNQIPTGNQPAGQSLYQFVLSRRTALQNLMRQYPGDVFVESAYIGTMQYYDQYYGRPTNYSDTVKVIAEYKARHEQHPENAEITYLYATALVGRDTPQAIKLFDNALEKDPNLDLPHLDFVTIYASPNFLDKAKAIDHEKTFLAACPAALQGYSSLWQIDDKELIAQSIPKLRQILQPRTDSDALRAYPTLWSLEFKAKPASDYDALRKQVAADVVRIRALNRQDLTEWWSALEDGYKLANGAFVVIVLYTELMQPNLSGRRGARVLVGSAVLACQVAILAVLVVPALTPRWPMINLHAISWTEPSRTSVGESSTGAGASRGRGCDEGIGIGSAAWRGSPSSASDSTCL